MASFEKRKTGWLTRVQRRGVRDSRTFDTKKEAQDWAKKREDEILRMGNNAAEVEESTRQQQYCGQFFRP